MVQSVTRTLDVLEALAAGDAGLSELAERVGLHPSTTHRLLATLVERGYVERGEHGRYALGHRAVLLADAAGRTEARVRELAAPHLRRIGKVSGETVNLSIRDGRDAVFVDQAFNAGSGARFVSRAVRLPAHVSASGKAMLAFAAPDEVRALLADGWDRYTPHTVAPGELEAQLAAARERGYAVDDQETKNGFVCVATPIFDRLGAAVAAMSIGAWRERIGEDLYSDLAELVGTACADVSADLGYRGRTPWTAPAAET
ncbi:MAG: IclR family transcriptional regulator [Pseudonocardia sp.]|uniref:IclR family transcriptional regulator n=1 Tax=unclassified Pseudonocardia TaxID=2619320 RepID=UPI00086A6D94|nr:MULTISPECIES: IclR family transcriptional regulator [unclassified Pseudonocardia]MBN9109358.1 IclR family transcriptional regulator [Pseudonocardia sp.]ODU29504.1 MAG: hypothetical protein ABS80_01740 [Pseudonocardia sp. SCN 72-51]ODV08070.1 MAG: hypothetical protein ABT15_05100 [Pseudonocardia sp. SCN 73-27]